MAEKCCKNTCLVYAANERHCGFRDVSLLDGATFSRGVRLMNCNGVLSEFGVFNHAADRICVSPL